MLSVRTLLVAVLAFVAIHFVSSQSSPAPASASEKIHSLKERAFTELTTQAPNSCIVGGVTGSCIEASSCTGKRYKGLCPKDGASIQCCIPAAASAAAGSVGAGAGAAAATSSAKSCKFGLQTGVCKKKSQCTGTAKAGLCPNSPADVQCCLSPLAAAASTPANTRRVLPPPGAACTAFGKKGKCGEIVNCKKGRPYPGWCGGPASVQCCIPNEYAPIKPGSYSAKKQRKITRTAAQRATEAEHTAKFNAFNTLFKKTYATAAKKAEAFLIFKENRLKNIRNNEAFAKGNVLFSSLTPFATLASNKFRSLYTGLRVRRPAAGRSFLEAEAEAGVTIFEPTEAQLQEARDIVRRAEQSDVSFLSHGAGLLVQEGEACGEANKGLCQGADNCLTSMGTPIEGTCNTEGNICCIPPGPVTPAAFNSSGATVTGALEVDFRNLLTPVKNQKSCGSCWAFTATSVVESAYTRATGTSTVLSPQFFVDCEPQSSGCAGGFPGDAFDLLKTTRQPTEAEYPYAAIKASTCAKPSGGSGPKTNGAVRITLCPDYGACADADNSLATKLLAGLKTYGPLSVILDASAWQTYKGGIFPSASCTPAWDKMNHAVQLVGFGSEGGKKFWLIRNSWDTWWGEVGFMRIEAFNGGSCGIGNYAQGVVYNGDTSSATIATPVSATGANAAPTLIIGGGGVRK